MSANDLRSRLLTVGMRLVLGWSLALTSVWFQATAQAADANATKGAPAKAGATAVAREEAAPEPEKIESAVCLGCHGNEGFGSTGPDGKNRSLHVEPDRFGGSVHGKQACVGCHTDITEIPHKAGTGRKVSCVQCHEDLWAKAQKAGTAPQHERLGVVVQQIQRYSKSVHAKAGKDDPSRPNANCYNCHDAHYVYPKDSPGRTAWRLTVPNACGTCHVKERQQYATSVHGKAVLQEGNSYAAICSDCHSAHDVADPAKDATQIAITQKCGTCHTDRLASYSQTYHGQVNRLGYAHTAKCFDCHGSHTIQRVDDPQSSVHPDKRLQTCQKCHAGATQGFVTFEPHGTSDDFGRFPYIWIASNFMFGLLAGTFAFFWTHTALWFYREYKDRKERRTRPHVQVEALPPQVKGKHYQRFPLLWRVGHLLFALSLMILTLTGMTVFYADSAWAPWVMRALGGPQVAAIIHRICAVIFATVFVAHLIYVLLRLARQWKTFRIFGPDSLIPRWQDFIDIYGMFRWFIGKGPRPVFDRWTYWEKFDYWAPFWGVSIIGFSGLMLWFPNVTAAFLPGWVFNVATIFHGEEALLAALFLFTVHFFNNHFRPDKFPLDVVMFTGSVPLEEFRREHTVEYNRLLQSGELQKYLVDEPSRPMSLGSRVLGFTLIGFGLFLLALVVTGMIGSLGRG